jgi:hypothetical protein
LMGNKPILMIWILYGKGWRVSPHLFSAECLLQNAGNVSKYQSAPGHNPQNYSPESSPPSQSWKICLFSVSLPFLSIDYWMFLYYISYASLNHKCF